MRKSEKELEKLAKELEAMADQVLRMAAVTREAIVQIGEEENERRRTMGRSPFELGETRDDV